MFGGDETVSDSDRTARHMVDVERGKCCTDTDDVDDGIGAADFMEFDIVDSDSMDPSFDNGELLEDGQGLLGDV